MLGVLSVALLAASFVWAHHWGPLADTIVIAWAVATLGSLVVSIQFLRDKVVWSTYGSQRLAKIGLAGGLISVAALVPAGVASAAGSTRRAYAAAADRPGNPGRTDGVARCAAA